MQRFSIIISFIIASCSISAQQLAKHNLYHANPNYINPAATGTRECRIFNITDKHQWIGIKGAPSIQVISVQSPRQVHKSKKHGTGLNITRDVNGAIQNLNAEFLYSFHIKFGRFNENFLSMGLSGNIGQHALTQNDFTENIFDPIVTGGIEQEISYNASSGLYIYSDSYFTGIAVYNLLPVNSILYQNYGNERFFITGILGKTIKPRNNQFQLKSSVYAAKGNNFMQFDLNNHFILNNNFWTGLTLRKYIGEFYNAGQNALIFLGYGKDDWNVTYVYDLGINSLQKRHFGSHQITIGYKICRDKYACPTYSKY